MTSRKQSEDFIEGNTHREFEYADNCILPHWITSQFYPEQDLKSTLAQLLSHPMKSSNVFEISPKAKL